MNNSPNQRVGLDMYYPKSVLLPENSNVFREVPDLKITIRPSEPLTSSELRGHDSGTIFYDVFHEHGNGRLMAIGPPLLNLKQKLLPMNVSVDKHDGAGTRKVGYKIQEFQDTTVYRFGVRSVRDACLQTTVRFEFANGHNAVVSTQACRRASSFLTLSCLQMNNEPVWVREWAEYWYLLGTDRMLIYDNGSKNLAAVVAELELSRASSAITIVSWPYPFGIVRSLRNRWAQQGQLAHAHMGFPLSKWLCSFDIDEYIALEKEDSSLPDILRQQSPLVGQLKLRPYSVPFVAAKETAPERVPTVRSFMYRSRDAGDATKYFVRGSSIRGLRSVHHATVQLRRTVLSDPKKLSFLHYGALTTGWKYPARLNPRELDATKLVKDTRVIDKFEQLGIR